MLFDKCCASNISKRKDTVLGWLCIMEEQIHNGQFCFMRKSAN
jgi:hypothetical protein